MEIGGYVDSPADGLVEQHAGLDRCRAAGRNQIFGEG